MLQVAFFAHICRTLPSIFAIILMSTHESFEMLRVCFSYKTTSLCLTCLGGQAGLSLVCSAILPLLTKLGQDLTTDLETVPLCS